MKRDLETAFEDLRHGLPDVMRTFSELHGAASGKGVLSEKMKKLIMVGISASIRCEPCIRTHVKGALGLGASREEILEAAGVAILMGGGPTAAYCAAYLLEELNRGPQDTITTEQGGNP